MCGVEKKSDLGVFYFFWLIVFFLSLYTALHGDSFDDPNFFESLQVLEVELSTV